MGDLGAPVAALRRRIDGRALGEVEQNTEHLRGPIERDDGVVSLGEDAHIQRNRSIAQGLRILRYQPTRQRIERRLAHAGSHWGVVARDVDARPRRKPRRADMIRAQTLTPAATWLVARDIFRGAKPGSCERTDSRRLYRWFAVAR